MSTRIKAALEAKLQDFLSNEVAGGVDEPEVYFPPSLTIRMAEAAYAVLMVSCESSQFTEKETAP